MSLSKKSRFEVFKRDKFTCQYCGRRPPDVMLEVDHVVPKVEDGGDDASNLTTACFACNRGKGGVSLGDVAPALDEMQVLEGIQEMLERRYALKAQIAAEREMKEVVEATHHLLLERWHEAMPWNPSFPFESVRPYLRSLDVSEVCEALDIAISWWNRADGKTAYDTAAYFIGILRNMAKAKEEG